MAEDSRRSDLIRAAGGLLWRDGPRGREVAVIHRKRHGGDWTLPKGKLRPGESWQDGAAREVREETGHSVRIGRVAGTVAYEVGGRPKVVMYFHLLPSGEQRSPLDDSEVAEVAWLTPVEALERLSYPAERALFEVLAEEGSGGES